MEEVSILIMVLRKIKKLDDIGAKKIPTYKLKNKSNARTIKKNKTLSFFSHNGLEPNTTPEN